jgi:uncharacterized protein YndB with AHSA1/START domain
MADKIKSGETGEQLVIVRKFNAPRQLVWDAFTKAEHLQHWWGPQDFDIVVHKFDLRPGGVFHYEMKSSDFSMWGLFNYREIDAPNRIVFTNAFADEKGNMARAPFFDGGWPLEILNTWTFEEEGENTIITLVCYPVDPSADELNTFKGNLNSMNEGTGSTFDKLDNYIKQLKS